MADTAARLAISARRNEVARFTIVVTGIDMTGVAMAMQIRMGRDVPGAALISLATVTSLAAEGLKLDSVTTTNGVPTSVIKGRINASTMTDATKVPYPAVVGDNYVMAYAMQWTLGGDAQTRLYGDFIVVASAFGSDGAPTNRPPNYGSPSASCGGADSGSLTFGDQIISVTLSSADQIAALVKDATASISASTAAAQGQAQLAGRYANNDSDAPIVGAPDTTSRGAKFWASTALARVQSLPNYYKGDPGGNILSITSFVAARATGTGANPMVIPSGTTVVMTAFHTTPRYGRAFYERRDDVNDAFLDSYPRISFKAKDENGNVTRWVLHAGKEWDYEAWGCVPYTGAINSATAVNDCSPAYDEMQAYNAAYPAIGNILYGFSGRKVSLGAGRFYHSRSHNSHARWDFVGAGAGGAGAVNTALVFAQNVHGVIINRHNTDAETVGGAFAYGRADGASYRLLAIMSLGGTDRMKHGVWMRARGTLEDVYIDGFPGNNVNIVANSSTDSQTGTNLTAGNANDWQMTRVSVSNSGQHGFYVAGIDANAGHAAGCEVLSAGCGGIVDVSFLGNKWTGCATHSTNSRGLGRVIYGGAVYDLINKTAGIGGSTTPGTNAAVWYQTGVSAAADTWVSGNEYIVSNCVFSDNVNARSIFDDFYVEGGTCIGHVATPSMVIGGQNDTKYTKQTPWMQSYGAGGGPILTTTGSGGFYSPDTFEPRYTTYGSVITSIVGYRMESAASEPRVWHFGSTLSDAWTINLKPGNEGWSWLAAGSLAVMQAFGRGTASTMGRSTPITRNTAANNSNNIILSFPNGFTFGTGGGRKIHQFTTTPPTGQDYAAGEFGYTCAPQTYKCLGYSCVTAAVVTAPAATSTTLTSEAVWYKAGALFIDATVTYDPASLAPGSVDAEQTVTVTGAALGDLVRMTYPGDSKGLVVNARVALTNTIKFFVMSPAGNPNGTVDLASAAFKIRVEKM